MKEQSCTLVFREGPNGEQMTPLAYGPYERRKDAIQYSPDGMSLYGKKTYKLRPGPQHRIDRDKLAAWFKKHHQS